METGCGPVQTGTELSHPFVMFNVENESQHEATDQKRMTSFSYTASALLISLIPGQEVTVTDELQVRAASQSQSFTVEERN